MSRVRRILTLVFVSLALYGKNVSGQELPTQPTFLTVASGVRLRYLLGFSLNADCTSTGEIVARIIQQPKNGMIEVAREQGYTQYGKEDQRYKCNEKRSEVVHLYYEPSERFKGKDSFVVEVFFPNGQYRKRVFNVTVR